MPNELREGLIGPAPAWGGAKRDQRDFRVLWHWGHRRRRRAAGYATSTLPPCRPSPQFFIDQIWPNFLAKDYGGKRCYDARCHDAQGGRLLSLTVPTTAGVGTYGSSAQASTDARMITAITLDAAGLNAAGVRQTRPEARRAVLDFCRRALGA